MSKALITVDYYGTPVVLTTDCVNVAWSCENISHSAEDVGLVDQKDCQEPGLYLWEGTSAVENTGCWDGPPEPELVFHGSVRKVRPGEVEELFRLKPPPNPEDDREEQRKEQRKEFHQFILAVCGNLPESVPWTRRDAALFMRRCCERAINSIDNPGEQDGTQAG